jgi:cobalt/nickel transport system permease protein
VIPALAHIGDDSQRHRPRRRSLARRTALAVQHAVTEVLENDEIASRPGLMQRLDPRVKLLTILLFAVTASFVHSLAVLLGLVVLTAGLAAASQLSVVSFSRKVWASAGFFALLLSLPAATAWITPGEVLIPLGPLSITQPGVYIAARLVTRVAAGAGIGLLVVWTTRWTDLLHALTALHMPDLIVATLAMTQKQIVTLLRTVENTHLARESRMLTAGSARDNRGWVTERMAFVARKSMKTADDVYDAMLARGFSGAMPSLVSLSTTARDWAWMTASVLACAVLLGVDRVVMPR